VVWCGVVWCGVVWCGVVWCGVVWCGVVWCGVMSAADSCWSDDASKRGSDNSPPAAMAPMMATDGGGACIVLAAGNGIADYVLPSVHCLECRVGFRGCLACCASMCSTCHHIALRDSMSTVCHRPAPVAYRHRDVDDTLLQQEGWQVGRVAKALRLWKEDRASLRIGLVVAVCCAWCGVAPAC
jgi:hypothetical protein